jgi:drebrin-like protein
VDDDEAGASAPAPFQAPAAAEPAHHEPEPTPAAGKGATATALYDYEAGEDNELSFPENAIINNVVSFARRRLFKVILLLTWRLADIP